MKKLFSLLFSLVVSYQLLGADESTTIATATSTSLQSVPIHLLSADVVNGAAATVTVSLYDAPSTSTTWVSGAYTNTLTYTTNIVVITTDYYGNHTTNTNAAVYTVANAVSAATNTYRKIHLYSAASGATTSWLPAGGVYLSYGLLAVNDKTNTTINYSYSTLR